MSEMECRCFIGGLAWSTTDRGLKEAFSKFGHLTKAKVVTDHDTGRSRGFGFITFDEKKSMEEAIEEMNGVNLDGRSITVDKAQSGSGRDRGGDRDSDRDRGGRDRGRDYGGGGQGSNSGECFKCGKHGHFARECPSGDSGGRGDRYGGGGGWDDRYGGGSGGGGSRYGPNRNGDRYGGGGHSRYDDSRSGSGSDRYSRDRDRSGPYERSSGGSYR